jgi:DNA repair ATPase RecN
MKEIMDRLQEARAQLDAVRSAMADPLKRWSTEPQRREVVPEVVAALSELIRREAAYQQHLEQVVLELAERIDRLSQGES